jgi:hypothetical protein
VLRKGPLASDLTAYSPVLADQKAAAVFTDPPYNVKINGHASGKGKIAHREFPMTFRSPAARPAFEKQGFTVLGAGGKPFANERYATLPHERGRMPIGNRTARVALS